MYLLEIRSEIRKWVIRTASRQRRCWGLRKVCLITVYTVSRNGAIFCTDTLTECDTCILQSAQDPPQRDEWLMSDTGWSIYKKKLLTHPPVLDFMTINLVSSEIVTCGETGWYMIWYDIFVNCNWVVTRWQYTFTHKQYVEQYKTTIHTTHQFWKSAGHAPSWLVLPWHLPYNRGKSTGVILALLCPLIASGSEKRRNGIDSLRCRENNYESKFDVILTCIFVNMWK